MYASYPLLLFRCIEQLSVVFAYKSLLGRYQWPYLGGIQAHNAVVHHVTLIPHQYFDDVFIAVSIRL